MKEQMFGPVLLLVFLVLSLPSISSADITDVSDVSFWSYPEYTRVVVTLSDNAEFFSKRIANPDRIYFDIKNSRIKKELKTNLPVGNGMLKSIRAGQFGAGTVRVVLDVEKIRDYKIMNLDDPARIIIDVYGGHGHPIFSTKKRVVIDAGHGGHDPGAVGPKSLYEKDVVLDVARKLKTILDRDPDLEVFLTRDKDVFLKLEERTAIANSKKADLFVSIHANSSTRKEAKGIETYLLNWTNDEEAMKVAARENRISLKKMKSMHKETDNILDLIKTDLMRESKRDESLKLANYIQHSLIADLNGEYEDIISHGVKQALFYVLVGAQMPSVLVEVSFISNPSEEKRLSTDEYRAELAKSIADGIKKYMAVSPEMKAVAGIRKTASR